MLDAPGTLAAEMVETADDYNAVTAAARRPELHQQIVIAAHAGTEPQAVASLNVTACGVPA